MLPQSSGPNISLLDVQTVASSTRAEIAHQPTHEETVKVVETKLKGYDGSGNTEEEDRLFKAHGEFIKSILVKGDLRQASSLWEKIQPIIAAREKELWKVIPGKTIHKGTPLYNTGLAFFVAGDFDSALRYFTEADQEDITNKGARPFAVIFGNHPLSPQVFIDPLVKKLVPHWVNDYRAITGIVLSATEIKELIAWLGSSPMDAVQILIALHRFQRSLEGLENPATQHLRVRAIADTLVVLESSLKHRFSPTTTMLGCLLPELLSGKTSSTSFRQLNSDFKNHFRSGTNPKCSPAAINWVTTKAISRIKLSSDPQVKIGLVCSLAQHLRNGLAHTIEPSLDIYSQRQLAIQVEGLAVCALRIAKHGAQGTL
jgi:hypothetical protein